LLLAATRISSLFQNGGVTNILHILQAQMIGPQSHKQSISGAAIISSIELKARALPPEFTRKVGCRRPHAQDLGCTHRARQHHERQAMPEG